MWVERIKIALDQTTNVVNFVLDLRNPATLHVLLFHNLVVEAVDIVKISQWRLLPLCQPGSIFLKFADGDIIQDMQAVLQEVDHGRTTVHSRLETGGLPRRPA